VVSKTQDLGLLKGKKQERVADGEEENAWDHDEPRGKQKDAPERYRGGTTESL